MRADLDDGSTVDAAYLVGADGVHSPVRSAIGQPFPGRSVIESIMLADVRPADPPEEALTMNGVGECFAFLAPSGDGWYRISRGTGATSNHPTPRCRSRRSAP